MGSVSPLHVVCLKWGVKYPPDHVNRLFNMVRRNLSVDFTFHCLTEDAQGLDPLIHHLPLETSDLKGWWYKLALFKKDFYGLEGDILYFDLDVVITGNIDFLASTPGDFVICRGWSRNLMWNSSVMRFKSGANNDIWQSFCENKTDVLANYNGDQEWIFKCRPNADIWPQNKIVSYKKSLNSKAFRWLEKLGLGRLGLKAPDWMDTPLPEAAAVVIFHGKPDPEDVAESACGFWKRASFISKHWR